MTVLALRKRVSVALAIAATAVAVVACGPVAPPPAPSPTLPPPRAGAASCPPAPAQPGLLKRLSGAGLKVTAASASMKEALFPLATSVCLMDVGDASLTVVFFADAATAATVRVCEQPERGRYLYRVNGQTIDAAHRIYWFVSDSVVVSTNSAGLAQSLRTALGGVSPPC